MLRRWRTYKSKLSNRARRGATAVEMALIAPAFFLLFLGVTEMSLILLAQHLLENATFNASRLAKTGYTESGQTQEQTVIAVLHDELNSLAPLIDISHVTMTNMAYASLSNIGQPEAGTQGMGTAQQVVVYTVSYPWKLFTPIIAQLIGDDHGELNLTTRIVVRNEPYG